MQAECILELEVKEKKKLGSLLTDTQIEEFETGKIAATCGGTKLKLEDDVRGIVLLLTPLQGG